MCFQVKTHSSWSNRRNPGFFFLFSFYCLHKAAEIAFHSGAGGGGLIRAKVIHDKVVSVDRNKAVEATH